MTVTSKLYNDELHNKNTSDNMEEESIKNSMLTAEEILRLFERIYNEE